MKTENNIVRMLMTYFNRKEYWSIHRRVKTFALLEYLYGYVLIGVLFAAKPLPIKTITFPNKIELNDRKIQRLTFKFPRIGLRLHSYFALPVVSNLHLAHFFNVMKKKLLDTGYDLLVIDAPIDSELDRTLKCVPAFLYWKQVKDRRMFFHLDGKQTTYPKLHTLTKKFRYKDLFEMLGARLEYRREEIICNRYITSISNETILPRSRPKQNFVDVPCEVIDPETIPIQTTEPKKVLELNTNKPKLKKYGW